MLDGDKNTNINTNGSSTKGAQTSSSSSPPLRVCCYGSSSKKTPKAYLTQAHLLGLTLARHGHTCVNGAGTTGCMGAMNEGVVEGDGDAVGVIHEMFIVDGGDWLEGNPDGIWGKDCSNGSSKDGSGGGKRELLLAKGEDLQQRKKMLVDGADAIVVLPGGPGTFDELWEMACSRSIGILEIPIVCVNVNGYYDHFAQMLHRANEDNLLYKEPKDILHFEPDSVKAVEWIERKVAVNKKREEEMKKNWIDSSDEGSKNGSRTKPRLRKSQSILTRASSMFSSDIGSSLYTLMGYNDQSKREEGTIEKNSKHKVQKILGYSFLPVLLTFSAGIVVGANLKMKK